MRWLGDGPYRVWKNRIHDVNFNVWEKDYNNTITGESFNNLVYPEFKGYHANVNWVRLETTESAFDILVETPNIFTQVFTPESPQQNRGGTVPPFPDADISFLYEIPAIGTKFKQGFLIPIAFCDRYYGRNRYSFTSNKFTLSRNIDRCFCDSFRKFIIHQKISPFSPLISPQF